MKIINNKVVTVNDLPKKLYSFLKSNDALYEYLHEVNKKDNPRYNLSFLENKGSHIWAAFEFYNSRKGLSYWGDLAGKYDRL